MVRRRDFQVGSVGHHVCACVDVLALPFALIEYAKHEQNNKAAARQKVQQLQIQTAIVEQQLQLKTSKTKPQTPKNRITIPITIEENHRQSVHN